MKDACSKEAIKRAMYMHAYIGTRYSVGGDDADKYVHGCSNCDYGMNYMQMCMVLLNVLAS